MARLRSDEGGFTLVEVMVAVLILAMGSMATLALLTEATRNAQRAKAGQIALEVAEQEMEYLRSLKNSKLALKASPAPSTNELNPNFRATEGKFALTRQPIGNYRNLVIDESGTVSPGPTPFTSGDVSGKIYRYVVWRNDESCSETKCPGRRDYKQIVVAVKPDKFSNEASERGYVEVQSNFIDPTKNAEDDPKPGPGGSIVSAQQFFLTDTPCAATGSTLRGEILGDHALHNTLGTCSNGLKLNTKEQGAPDALVLGSPPDPAPEDDSNPALYDYDTSLEPTPDTDKGLQVLKDDTAGCNYTPTGTTNPAQQVHRWVTDPMQADFVMNEKATLEFYTRTINDALYNGKLCVYLFKRPAGSSPTDIRLKNLNGGTEYWTYTPESGEFWPRFEWKKVRLTMFFSESSPTILKGERLGLAVSVERNGTPQAEAIPIMYDHPRYPSRIEVDTTTPVNGG
jgi:prepilin-type N-terminal cleavage/methylation domain-containing protein